VTCATCKRRGWDKARNCAGDPSSRRVVWRGGKEEKGEPRVTTTICPVRQIDPETSAVVEWFLRSQSFDGLSTLPSARVEWPRPGGLARQNPRLVAAFDILRFEVPHLALPKKKRDAEKPGGPIPNPRRRRRRRGRP
jgi:hypothetical protein